MAAHTRLHKKLETARQELLDLGLRNPLLNYRTLKARGLEVVQENPADVYSILVTDKKKMTFEENSSAPEQEHHEDGLAALEEHAEIEEQKYHDSKLQTNYSFKQLEKRLLNTYYFARTYIEEQGVNILYLALGMLEWIESDSSKEVRKAPLVLVPVQLERGSARERFKISYTEDEIGHNISLAAKLKAEFGLEFPGFLDDEEFRIDAYFSKVNAAVDGMKGWSVDTKSVVVGFFSFGKFLMYRDLDMTIWPEYSRPEEHPVLTALLEEGFREEASQISEDDHLDQYIDVMEAKHVMDADSSQIVAIQDAKQGRNMVIQGPPGTGKSQTITNLIAEAIGEGKKILFVSEKMAALEVVKRRLDSLGLGVACLELHSHKSNKKELLTELANTLDLGKPKLRENGEIKLLEDMRNRLNDYCMAVNGEVDPTGVTPFQALGELVLYQAANKEMKLPKVAIPTIEQWSKDEYRKREALVEELQKLIQSIGLPARHPFWGSKRKVVLPAELDALKQMLIESSKMLEDLGECLQKASAALDHPAPLDRKETRTLVRVLERLSSAPNLDGVEVKSTIWTGEKESLRKWIEAGRAYNKIHDQYDAVLIPEAWNQDMLETRQSLVRYQDKWWRFLSGDYRKAKSKVVGLLKNPKEKSVPGLEVAEAILEATRQKEAVASRESLAEEVFASQWRGLEDSDWGHLQILFNWLLQLHEDIANGELPEAILDKFTLLPEKSILLELHEVLAKSSEECTRSLLSLEEFLELDSMQRVGAIPFTQQPYTQIAERLAAWLEQLSRLQEMASYNNLVVQCEAEQLQPLVAFCEDWDHAGEHLVDCFKWNRHQAIISRAFHERPALASFDCSRHEHAVQKFQEMDRYLADYNKARLAEAHWNKLPQHEAGGQLGVLLREFEKKTRHLPIRQLMIKAGHAVQAIKPIFMMGPLSIATYLQPGTLEFDLVIFDEASQVKPVDAFGAIIRAKQAIVVGDSKQMPPTNFFDSIAKEDDGDDDDFVTDMESVLGLFVGQNAPQRMLRWHYRSRHESLITVSNHEFYEDKLVIFPSPDEAKSTSGLIYRHLHDTAYDRGRTRTNPLEAQEVARAVMEHARECPHLTLGVAAFSMAQMQAIMDEVEVMRRADAATESFFTAHPHEPFFVKNLENVQGDERDVIFISIGYGKTSEGYLAMDFGALNRDGGERRLNVLITRARIRCEVFTNLKSEDIDLNRSAARGVKALKTFLKYAESGNLDIPQHSGRDFDSPFEEAVFRSLSELGYQVKPQVGSAGFFVDLGVMDPDTPGKFVLGIECDGATYHSARSARDRDRLRQQVLEGLGWNIHRIWSTDWFRHPERELKRVVEAIEQAKIKAKVSSVQKPVRPKQEYNPIKRDDTEVKATEQSAAKYQVAELNIHLEGREFHTLPLSLIASWVAQVVRIEGPVHVSEVMKRICEALGIKRVGTRIQEGFERSFSVLPDVYRKGEFLWHREMKVVLPRDRSELKTKKLELVPEEEIQEALVKVIRDSYGIEVDHACSQCGQLLGFSRVTEEAKAAFEEVINKLVDANVLIKKDQTLVVA